MIVTFEDGIKKTYTIKCIEKLKEEFRIKNNTDKVIAMLGKDSAYDRYCEELENMKNDKYRDECNKYREDLEKIKDIGERIRVAKSHREKKETPWQKKMDKEII